MAHPLREHTPEEFSTVSRLVPSPLRNILLDFVIYCSVYSISTYCGSRPEPPSRPSQQVRRPGRYGHHDYENRRTMALHESCMLLRSPGPEEQHHRRSESALRLRFTHEEELHAAAAHLPRISASRAAGLSPRKLPQGMSHAPRICSPNPSASRQTPRHSRWACANLRQSGRLPCSDLLAAGPLPAPRCLHPPFGRSGCGDSGSGALYYALGHTVLFLA